MMSRITLNLKKAGVQFKSDDLSVPKTLLFDRGRKRSDLFDANLAFNIVSTPPPVSSASTRPYGQIRTFSPCSGQRILWEGRSIPLNQTRGPKITDPVN